MKNKIHPSIKTSLGYDENMPDKEFKDAWKKKSTRVCKPCWELKYCPYGWLVQQSPTLKSTRENAIAHNEYLKKCLETNLTGEIVNLTKEDIEEKKKQLESFKKNPHLLLPEIYLELLDDELIEEGTKNNLKLFELYQTPHGNLELFESMDSILLGENEEKVREELLEELSKIEITPDFQKLINEKIQQLEIAIATGKFDRRQKLDSVRRQYFEEQVEKFNPDDYPEFIPEVVSQMVCNVFHHICPVAFVSEASTETTLKRRKGPHIPNKVRYKVIARDGYVCQICRKNVRDDELEFDHIIPTSRGGSSEVHNIRVTCYNCNRDKSDDVEI